MRLAERQRIAAEKAQELMTSEDYRTMVEAIRDHKPVLFKYTDRFGTYAQYRANYVEGFVYFPETNIWPGSVCVWSFHSPHNKKEQYRVERIEDVKFVITLLEALLDPSSCADFWAGEPALTGWEPSFEELSADIKKQTSIGGEDRVVLAWLRKNLPFETKLFGGPGTVIEHKVYTMNIAGIPIYFDEVNDAVVILIREILVGTPLPKLLRDLITGIQIVEEFKRDDPLLIAWNIDGFITIYGDHEMDIGKIAHEAAHEFSFTKWDWGMPVEGSDYLAAIKSGEPPVSEYSKRNTGEDFAEAVRMFVVDPAGLQKIAPLRYKVIKRLMEDKEYAG